MKTSHGVIQGYAGVSAVDSKNQIIISAQPVQAAFSSAGIIIVGAALPLMMAWAIPGSLLIPVVAVSSLVFLALLDGIAARAGGAPILSVRLELLPGEHLQWR